jgi:predicted nuclease of predicted toxin-antitoxin system
MASRLLFDENLSPRLAVELTAVFPESNHVRDVQLKGASDQVIWQFAAEYGYSIVTKDDDFRGLSLLRGAPPKVIWLVVGNTSTAIKAFITEPITSLLTLRKP